MWIIPVMFSLVSNTCSDCKITYCTTGFTQTCFIVGQLALESGQRLQEWNITETQYGRALKNYFLMMAILARVNF